MDPLCRDSCKNQPYMKMAPFEHRMQNSTEVRKDCDNHFTGCPCNDTSSLVVKIFMDRG